MADDTKYTIEIYHNGVVWKAPLRGKQRYLKVREFLNQLCGFKSSTQDLDSTPAFYMLDDEQLEAYSAFRRAK